MGSKKYSPVTMPSRLTARSSVSAVARFSMIIRVRMSRPKLGPTRTSARWSRFSAASPVA